TGCAATARTPIIVPPEAVREWAYNSDGETGEGRYVVRMTDGRREWEVEFPDARYGSEVRGPLKNGGHQLKLQTEKSNLTAADRELQDADRRTREKPDAVYDFVDGKDKSSDKPSKLKKAKTSYLVGVAQVRELYEARNLEIALVQLVELEKEYPNDEK